MSVSEYMFVFHLRKEENPESLAVLLMLNIAAQFFQSRVVANPLDV